jgi:hypothetical protein
MLPSKGQNLGILGAQAAGSISLQRGVIRFRLAAAEAAARIVHVEIAKIESALLIRFGRKNTDGFGSTTPTLG